LHKVIGERIVVINHQQHPTILPPAYSGAKYAGAPLTAG